MEWRVSNDMRREMRDPFPAMCQENEEGDPALKQIERECVKGKPHRVKEERHVEGKILHIRQAILPPFHMLSIVLDLLAVVVFGNL